MVWHQIHSTDSVKLVCTLAIQQNGQMQIQGGHKPDLEEGLKETFSRRGDVSTATNTAVAS